MPAEYEPTADQRALVENAAAFGLLKPVFAVRHGFDVGPCAAFVEALTQLIALCHSIISNGPLSK
jgi:hypothetical protein